MNAYSIDIKDLKKTDIEDKKPATPVFEEKKSVHATLQSLSMNSSRTSSPHISRPIPHSNSSSSKPISPSSSQSSVTTEEQQPVRRNSLSYNISPT